MWVVRIIPQLKYFIFYTLEYDAEKNGGVYTSLN